MPFFLLPDLQPCSLFPATRQDWVSLKRGIERPSPQPLRGDVGILCHPFFFFATGMKSTGNTPGRQLCLCLLSFTSNTHLSSGPFHSSVCCLLFLASLHPPSLPPVVTQLSSSLSVSFGPLVWRRGFHFARKNLVSGTIL